MKGKGLTYPIKAFGKAANRDDVCACVSEKKQHG